MKMMKVFLFLIVVFVASHENVAGPGKFRPAARSVQDESKKANEFFENVFNELVDRSPMYQTYLGIKKDYGKLDDISDENELREMEILKANLLRLKKEIKFNLL